MNLRKSNLDHKQKLKKKSKLISRHFNFQKMAADESIGDALEKSSQRSDVVLSVISILETQKDFRNIKVLGQGTYGDVHLMYDPRRDSTIAVKIVTSENISESELVLWPELDHPNIVPLLEFLTLSPLDVAIFIMPVLRTTLNDVLYERHFKRSYHALDKVKAWLYQILCGLEYLNSKELCHLDIKVDNVLISNASAAMLCDFSFLNVTTKRLKRYDLGLPYIYRPPEACQSMGSDIRIDGKSYDSWGYGAMLVEIFTHFYLASSIPKNKCWLKDVYPTLFDIIQEDHFINLMTKTFPAVRISSVQAKLALNFVHGFLMMDFEKRISPLEATQHPFLKKGTILAPPPDCIWRRKVSTCVENIAWFKKECIKNFATKDEKIYSEETIYQIGKCDREYEASEDSAYLNSPETDDESETSISDDQSGDNDSIIGEPDRISFQDYEQTNDSKNDVLDVESDDEVRIVSPTKNKSCSKKFKSYINSLERLNNDKYELPIHSENDHHDRCEEIIKNEMAFDSSLDWVTTGLRNIKLDCSSSLQKDPKSDTELKRPILIPEFTSTFGMSSSVSKMELFSDFNQTYTNSESCDIALLSNDFGNMELLSVLEDDSSVTESNITDATHLPYDRDFEDETYVSEDPAKEDISQDVKLSECPTGEIDVIPSTDSKWATGDSLKSVNSPEKTSSNEYAAVDQVSVAKQVKSLRQRLSKLDQMFGQMEKVMVCENCSNIGKSEEEDLEKKPLDVSSIAASGENCFTGDNQNSYQEIRKNHFDTYDDVQMNSQLAPGLVSEGDDFNLINDSPTFQYSPHGFERNFEGDIDKTNHGGNGRKHGRHRKIIQWIRYKYLDMERVMKRWPYKIMKDQR